MSDKSSNKKSIISSTLIVSLLAVFIKFTGLVKQSVLAAYCGATEETDVFFIVSGVLTSLCGMIFSAISVTALTIHTDILISKGRDKSNDYINKVLRCFMPVAVVITILFIVLAPYIAKFLAPTYSSEQIELMSKYIRMMSVVFVLTCYYLTVNVVLETDKRFVPRQIQNLFQNIFLIVSAVFVYSRTGVNSLIWSFILSGLAECILVTWCARKEFGLIWKKLTTPLSEIKRLYILAIPLIIGSAVYEVNDIVDKQISSSLGEGCVSYLTYGSTINEIVTGVIVMALSTVLFAHFATLVSEGNKKKIEETLKRSLTFLTIVILPFLILCTVAGDDIVRIFYARGNFGENDVYYTYWVSVGYAIGFIFSSYRAIMVKVLYAFKDTRGAMKNGIFSVVINITLSIVLSRFIGVWGISLATSIAMLFSVLFMAHQIRVHLPLYTIIGDKTELVKGSFAFLCSGSLVFLLSFINIENTYIDLTIKGVACIFSYLLMLAIFKSSSTKFLFEIIRTKRL